MCLFGGRGPRRSGRGWPTLGRAPAYTRAPAPTWGKCRSGCTWVVWTPEWRRSECPGINISLGFNFGEKSQVPWWRPALKRASRIWARVQSGSRPWSGCWHRNGQPRTCSRPPRSQRSRTTTAPSRLRRSSRTLGTHTFRPENSNNFKILSFLIMVYRNLRPNVKLWPLFWSLKDPNVRKTTPNTPTFRWS